MCVCVYGCVFVCLCSLLFKDTYSNNFLVPTIPKGHNSKQNENKNRKSRNAYLVHKGAHKHDETALHFGKLGKFVPVHHGL